MSSVPQGSTALSRVVIVVRARLLPIFGTVAENAKSPTGIGQKYELLALLKSSATAGRGDGGRNVSQNLELFVNILRVNTEEVVNNVAKR